MKLNLTKRTQGLFGIFLWAVMALSVLLLVMTSFVFSTHAAVTGVTATTQPYSGLSAADVASFANAVTDKPEPLPDLITSLSAGGQVYVNYSVPFTADIRNLTLIPAAAQYQPGSPNGGVWAIFPVLFQVATDANGTDASDLIVAQSGPIPYGGDSKVYVTATFSSTGVYFVRSCADKSSGGDVAGVVAESDENNNCTDWQEVDVVNLPPPPDGSVTTPTPTPAPVTPTPIPTPATASVTIPLCTNPNHDHLPDLTAGAITPTSAAAGTAKDFSTVITNTGQTSTDTGFSDLLQKANSLDANGDGVGVSDIDTYASDAIAATFNNTATFSYTFPDVDAGTTKYLRACADKNAAGDSGVVAELNEDNNCGAWTAVTVGAVAPGTVPTVVLTALPDTIVSGGRSLLVWAAQNATSCTGSPTDFAKGALANSVGAGVSPGSTTAYSIVCTDGKGHQGTSNATVTVVSAKISLTATPSLLRKGETSTITWKGTGSSISSCSISGPGLSSSALTGTQPVKIDSESTYIFGCHAGSLDLSTSTTVKLIPAGGEI